MLLNELFALKLKRKKNIQHNDDNLAEILEECDD